MTNGAYKRAKEVALNNGQIYHLAAILFRKKEVVRIGTNSNKTHPRFYRVYPDGSCRSHLHAEMDVLRFAQPGDKIIVVRFSAEGLLTMAKPCSLCQKHLADSGIDHVTYSNWDGELKRMKQA